MDARGGAVRRRPRMEGEIDPITAAQAGDEMASAALIAKYRSFVRCKARSYFLAGADRDDVIQEGMIGLYKAIRDFRSDHQSSVRSIAALRGQDHQRTGLKMTSRQKHSHLNTEVTHQPTETTSGCGATRLHD